VHRTVLFWEGSSISDFANCIHQLTPLNIGLWRARQSTQSMGVSVIDCFGCSDFKGQCKVAPRRGASIVSSAE